MTTEDIKALRWAIEQAETWRGAFTGNSNPFPLRRFNTDVRRAKAALRAARKLVKK